MASKHGFLELIKRQLNVFQHFTIYEALLHSPFKSTMTYELDLEGIFIIDVLQIGN